MKDAKGHGSNKRGTHSSKVNAIGNIQLHPSVFQVIKQNPGGFSVRPNGKMPTSGFMVSAPGHTKILSERDLSGPNGPKLIEQYAREHADVLQQPGAHIGGWTDQASGKTYLDISHNMRRAKEAVKAGHARNQIAIWDVKTAAKFRPAAPGPSSPQLPVVPPPSSLYA